MKKILFIILLTFCCSNVILAAKGKLKTIKGQVTDSEGIPLVGAKVSIDGYNSSVYTDFEGEFILTSISKGTHKIKVSMISFEEKVSIVDIQSTDSKKLSIELYSK